MPVRAEIIGIIQVAMGDRSWAPKARILFKLQPEEGLRSGSEVVGC